jgi:hypothetical protein
VSHIVPLFTVNMFKNLIKEKSSNDVEISFVHYPMPLTTELE